MRGYVCDFCGLSQSDLMDEEATYAEHLFEVSDDGRHMACQGCSIGREGFHEYHIG